MSTYSYIDSDEEYDGGEVDYTHDYGAAPPDHSLWQREERDDAYAPSVRQQPRAVAATVVQQQSASRAAALGQEPLSVNLTPALERQPTQSVVDPGRSIAIFASLIAGHAGVPYQVVFDETQGTLSPEFIGLAIHVHGEITQVLSDPSISMQMLMYEVPGEQNVTRNKFAHAVALYKRFQAPGSANLTASYVRTGSETARYNLSYNPQQMRIYGNAYRGTIEWFRRVYTTPNPLLAKYRKTLASARSSLSVLGSPRSRTRDDRNVQSQRQGTPEEFTKDSFVASTEDESAAPVRGFASLSAGGSTRDRLKAIVETSTRAIATLKREMPMVVTVGTPPSRVPATWGVGVPTLRFNYGYGH